jgi:hypothetical protein
VRPRQLFGRLAEVVEARRDAIRAPRGGQPEPLGARRDLGDDRRSGRLHIDQLGAQRPKKDPGGVRAADHPRDAEREPERGVAGHRVRELGSR